MVCQHANKAQLDVACWRPSMHGWRHRVPRMESMRQQLTRPDLWPRPCIERGLVWPKWFRLFHGKSPIRQSTYLLCSIPHWPVQWRSDLLQSQTSNRFDRLLCCQSHGGMGFPRSHIHWYERKQTKSWSNQCLDPLVFQSDTHDRNGLGVRHALQNLHVHVSNRRGPRPIHGVCGWFQTMGWFGPWTETIG